MNGSEADQRQWNERAATILGWVQLGAGVIGAPANALVLAVCLQLLGKGGRPSQLIVLSMTTADLVLTTFYSGLFSARQLLRLPFPSRLCAAMFLGVQIPSVASSLSLLLLNVDKLACLQAPLWHAVVASRSICLTAVTAVWLTSLVWSANFVLPNLNSISETCQYRPQVELLVGGLVVFFLFPILLSSVLSCRVVAIVLSARRPPGRRTAGRSILFVFATTLWSALTTVPYRLAYLLLNTGVIGNEGRRAIWFLYILLAINPALNPLITVATQRRYLAALRRLAILIFRRNRRQPRLSREFSSWPMAERRRDTMAMSEAIGRPQLGLKSSFSRQVPPCDPPVPL